MEDKREPALPPLRPRKRLLEEGHDSLTERSELFPGTFLGVDTRHVELSNQRPNFDVVHRRVRTVQPDDFGFGLLDGNPRAGKGQPNRCATT
jgi:hypothetical protein